MRILIVDDTTSLRILLRKYLEEDGFEVQEAEDCKMALETIARNPPDLVLLDVIMPEMDGIECCQKIKSNVTTSGIPVIIMTAPSTNNQKQSVYSAGSDSLLLKPIVKEILLSKVRLFCKIGSGQKGS